MASSWTPAGSSCPPPSSHASKGKGQDALSATTASRHGTRPSIPSPRRRKRIKHSMPVRDTLSSSPQEKHTRVPYISGITAGPAYPSELLCSRPSSAHAGVRAGLDTRSPKPDLARLCTGVSSRACPCPHTPPSSSHDTNRGRLPRDKEGIPSTANYDRFTEAQPGYRNGILPRRYHKPQEKALQVCATTPALHTSATTDRAPARSQAGSRGERRRSSPVCSDAALGDRRWSCRRYRPGGQTGGAPRSGG